MNLFFIKSFFNKHTQTSYDFAFVSNSHPPSSCMLVIGRINYPNRFITIDSFDFFENNGFFDGHCDARWPYAIKHTIEQHTYCPHS